MSTYLVTGTAGFIGFHLAGKLLSDGNEVIGYDNVNDYYDVTLKEARNKVLEGHPRYRLIRADLRDRKKLEKTFERYEFEKVVHLAAQAGVRYSLEHPEKYIESNIEGFLNILECCRYKGPKDLIYASSSSVYGGNEKVPFSVEDRVDSPISLYAATKKGNELMAHVYSHLFDLNTTGLRFFTVYGPYGRPDMAMFKFTKAILAGRPLDLYNDGNMERDFTYIDDVVSGIKASMERPFRYEVLNLGNNNPVTVNYLVLLLEKELGRKAKRNPLPIQPGDVQKTFADIDRSKELLGYEPKTPIEVGVKRFVGWYREYHGL